jgi:hypothetical protein
MKRKNILHNPSGSMKRLKQHISLSKRTTVLLKDCVRILSLPNDIHGPIAEYLDVKDALNYQMTCKTIQNSLQLGLLPVACIDQLADFHGYGDRATGDRIGRYKDLGQFYFADKVHTAIFSCDYVDQGWGNLKGKIYITESDSPFPKNDCKVIGKILATSPTAEHIERHLMMKFKVKPGRFYAICITIGGGGGHELNIRNQVIRSLIHAPCNVNLMNTLSKAVDQKNTFVLDVIKSVLQASEENIDNLSTTSIFPMFLKYDIDLSNPELVRAVKTVVSEFSKSK